MNGISKELLLIRRTCCIDGVGPRERKENRRTRREREAPNLLDFKSAWEKHVSCWILNFLHNRWIWIEIVGFPSLFFSFWKGFYISKMQLILQLLLVRVTKFVFIFLTPERKRIFRRNISKLSPKFTPFQFIFRNSN